MYNTTHELGDDLMTLNKMEELKIAQQHVDSIEEYKGQIKELGMQYEGDLQWL